MTTITADAVIYNSPDKSRMSMVRDVVLCLAMWYLYYWLMQDFINFITTILVWEIYGEVRPGLPGAFRILATMKDYALVVLALGSLLLSWAIYNRARFRSRERRRSAAFTTTQETAQFFKVSPEDIAQWHEARIMVIHHDRHGNLTDVNIKAVKSGGKPRLAIVAA